GAWGEAAMSERGKEWDSHCECKAVVAATSSTSRLTDGGKGEGAGDRKKRADCVDDEYLFSAPAPRPSASQKRPSEQPGKDGEDDENKSGKDDISRDRTFETGSKKIRAEHKH